MVKAKCFDSKAVDEISSTPLDWGRNKDKKKNEAKALGWVGGGA